MSRSKTWALRQIATGGTPANVLWWDFDDASAPAQASSSSIWTVGKIATNNYSVLNNGSTQGTGTFSTTVVPTAAATPAVTNSFASVTGYTPPTLLLDTSTISTLYEFNGYFPAGNWVFTFPVVATTTSSQQGAITMRVWKAKRSGTTFSGVTELTSALQTGTTVTVTATAASSVVTWAAPAFFLNNEFLICDIAWKIVVASGSNSGNVLLRYGSGCTMVSPAARERIYNIN